MADNIPGIPSGCSSRETWRVMLNLRDEETDGRPFYVLGSGGVTGRLLPCPHQPRCPDYGGDHA